MNAEQAAQAEFITRVVQMTALDTFRLLKEESQTHPKEAKSLLSGAWHSHVEEFKRLLQLLSKGTMMEMDIKAIVAFAVLEGYFRTKGDWDEAIRITEERLK